MVDDDDGNERGLEARSAMLALKNWLLEQCATYVEFMQIASIYAQQSKSCPSS